MQYKIKIKNVISLVTDLDVYSVFQKLRPKGSLFLSYFNKNEIAHQVLSAQTLLHLEMKENLSDVFKFPKADILYKEYKRTFPYKHEEKESEILRFLQFLYLKCNEDENELKHLVKNEILTYISTIKKNRRDSYDITFNQATKNDPLFINTTLTLGALKIATGNRFCLYFYPLNETDISIAEINGTAFKYISNILDNQNMLNNLEEINLEEIAGVLSITREELLECGLLVGIET